MTSFSVLLSQTPLCYSKKLPWESWQESIPKVLSSYLRSQVSGMSLGPLKTIKFQHFEVTNIVSAQSSTQLSTSILSFFFLILLHNHIKEYKDVNMLTVVSEAKIC